MAQKHKKKRPRTYARNRAFSRRGYEKLFETDGEYFLKLVLVVILGAAWLKFKEPLQIGGMDLYGLPIGSIVGAILIALFEKSQLDRKIWYAVLVIVTILCFFAPSVVYF